MQRTVPISVLQTLIGLGKSRPPLFEKGDRTALVSLFSECESDHQVRVIEELIAKFNYLTSADLDVGANLVVQQISQQWKLDGSTTVLVAIADDEKPDGSQVFAKSIYTALSKIKSRYTVKSHLSFAFQEAVTGTKPYSTIVLIDDFIGTGDKLSKTIARLQKHTDSKALIYVVALGAMKFGAENITASTGCEVFACHLYERGISEATKSPEREEFIEAMIELERKIIPPMRYPRDLKERNYSFGYGQSEALFFLEGFSVPNNVFPIFWRNKYCELQSYMPSKTKPKRGATNERTALLSRA